MKGARDPGDDTPAPCKDDPSGRVAHEMGDELGRVGNNPCRGNEIDDKIDEEVHDVDHEADDRITKSNENQGDEEVGEGALDSDNCLGVDFSAQHNHDAHDDKHDDVERICKVAEYFPEGQEGRHIVVPIAGTSGGGIGTRDRGNTNII